MTSTLSAILMEIVQKAMEAQNLSTTPRTTTATATMATSSYSSLTTAVLFTPNKSADLKHRNSSIRCPPRENWTGVDELTFPDCYNASVNETGLDSVARSGVSYWALALLLIPTFTLFGNLLVIISVVRCRNLHSPINYFILGLAIADMCVAMAVMPFAVYVEFNDNWELGTLLCDLYCAADVTCSTASIFLLTVISFDRYVAATQPIRYANSAKGIGRVAAINLAVWLVSMLIASPMVLGLNNVPVRDESKCMFYNADFIIYSSTGSFCIPLVIIIYLYGRIYCVIRERSRFAQQRRHILGAASRFSVAGAVEKSVVICAADRVSQTAAPTAAPPSASASDKGSGDSVEKEKLLDMVTAVDGFDSVKENGARRRSKSVEPIAARGHFISGSRTSAKSAFVSLDSNANKFTAAEKRKNRFARTSKSTCSSSAASTGGHRSSSRISTRTTRSGSVSSSTSSADSASTTKEDTEICDYSPHIDLIRHLQKTSHALASRHRRIPDGKRKSFLFTGACNSFFRNVSSVASSDVVSHAESGSKRFSWHPSNSTTTSTNGRSSSQARTSESVTSSSTRPESASPPPRNTTAPSALIARSKSSTVNEENLPENTYKPSLSATISLNPSVVGGIRAQSASPTVPESLRSPPQQLLQPPSVQRPPTYRRQRNPPGSLSVDQAVISGDELSFMNEHDFSDRTILSAEDDGHSNSSAVSSMTSTFFRNTAPLRNYETFKPFTLRETTISIPSKNTARRNTVAPCAVEDNEQLSLRIIENLSVTHLDSPTDNFVDPLPKMNGTVANISDDGTTCAEPDRVAVRTCLELPEAAEVHRSNAAPRIRSHVVRRPITDPNDTNFRWYRRLSTRLSMWRRRREFVCTNGNAGITGRVVTANKSVAVAAAAVASSRVQPAETILPPPAPVSHQAPKQPKALKKVTKSQRKEKKATKTLAIVLGIFLICWLPFFTLNLLNAVCIKLDYQSCQVGFLPFFLTTWLGYMNSLMNPIIYTIFNLDFRRAFKQILCPCFVKHRTRRV